MSEANEHITYILENDEKENEFDVLDFMNEFNKLKYVDESKSCEMDDMYASITDYDDNYTGKQLLQICEFYGFAKEVRNVKSKKIDLVSAIVMFERNPENGAQVYRRKQLWYYINELKRDKFMKKFIIW